MTQDRWAALVLFTVLAVETVTARWLILGSLESLVGLASDIAFIALSAVLISIAPRRLAVPAGILLSAVISFVLLACVIYSKYYAALPTVGMLAFLGQAGDVHENIADLWVAVDLIFIVGPIAVAVSSVAVRTKRFAVGLTHVFVGTALLVIPVWSTGSLLGLGGPVDSLIATRERGVVAYQFSTAFGRSTAEAPVVDDADDGRGEMSLAEEIDSILGRSDARRIVRFKPGALKGKNVLIVQFEALQTYALGYSAEGTEITPNLNKLVKRSILFPNGIGQIALGNTSDAEWVSNSGLYPAVDKASSIRWGDKEVPALPRLLSNEGYFTFTMHPNNASFWNRRQLYASLGFDKYYDVDFFGAGPLLGGSRGDDALYDMAIPEIEKLHKSGKPFYGNIITISSHSPFGKHAEMRTSLDLPKGYTEASIAGYLQSIRDADRAFGTFVDRLEEKGILDDTVLIVFGDHFGPRLEAAATTKPEAIEFFGRPYTSMERLTIPVIIHLPEQKVARVETEPLGEIDVMPTVADLLGLDMSAVPHFGRSAFMVGRTLVVPRKYAAAGSYVVSEGMVEMTGLGFKDARSRPVSGSTAPVPILQADYDDALRLVALSDAYADSLPVRNNVEVDAEAVIPTKGGRGKE